MKPTYLLLILAVCLAACAPAAGLPPTPTRLAEQASPTPIPPTATPQPPTPAPTAAGPSLAELKNGSFYLESHQLKVTLKDGIVASSDPAALPGLSPAKGQMIEPVVFGDLNGDGLPDAAFTIAINTGGTGTFHSLIVVLAQKGQAASISLGDRISVKTLAISGGILALDWIRGGPKDPLCCPSEHALTTYQFKDGAFIVASDKIEP